MKAEVGSYHLAFAVGYTACLLVSYSLSTYSIWNGTFIP